ncbi:MAG TPA: DnaJ C-terminal domain-containing protein [Stellaceae bacterium]|nr:DnaJ C-terminal domain-containing protein [Stellaceae bacterium]
MMDPYAQLGLGRDASIDDIKRAYRKLVKEVHPDLNPGDPMAARRFEDLTVAYDTLVDPEKRKRWDAEAATRARFGKAMGGDDALSEFFRRTSKFTGGGQAPRPKRPGADTSHVLEVSLVEAAIGARKHVAMIDGRTVDLVIPPATEAGQTLRLKGRGAVGQNGGPSGDAYVTIKVIPHPQLNRAGNDITMTLPVTVAEATLGAAITVPTLTGPVTLKVPKGSNSDTILRLKGRGVPLAGEQASGDQLVILKVMLPPETDPTFMAFVEQWSKTSPYKVR